MLLGDWESIEAQYRALETIHAERMLRVLPLLRDAPELAAVTPGLSLFNHQLYLTFPGTTDRVYVVPADDERYEITLIHDVTVVLRRQAVPQEDILRVVTLYLASLIH
jgi:hypothetical protein